jgi:hypothetical protein
MRDGRLTDEETRKCQALLQQAGCSGADGSNLCEITSPSEAWRSSCGIYRSHTKPAHQACLHNLENAECHAAPKKQPRVTGLDAEGEVILH